MDGTHIFAPLPPELYKYYSNNVKWVWTQATKKTRAETKRVVTGFAQGGRQVRGWRPAAGWDFQDVSEKAQGTGVRELGVGWSPEEGKGVHTEVMDPSSFSYTHQHHQPPIHETESLLSVKTRPGGNMDLRNEIRQRPGLRREVENREIKFCNWTVET